MPAPVLVFAYNRPDHLQQTLAALAANDLAGQSEVFIYCDAAKAGSDPAPVNATRAIARQAQGFASVSVCEWEENMGCAASIISGVTEQMEKYGQVIVVEDDIVTSPHFLDYMNRALDFYAKDPKVFMIGGFSFPEELFQIPSDYPWDTYATLAACSWGWATWADRWNSVDWSMSYYEDFAADPGTQAAFDCASPIMSELLHRQHQGRVDSWAIRFAYAQFAADAHCIQPCRSMVINIGFDGSGVHCRGDKRFLHNSIDHAWVPYSFCPGYVVSESIIKGLHYAFLVQRADQQKHGPFSLLRSLIARLRSRVARWL